jgi:hypothetical protein
VAYRLRFAFMEPETGTSPSTSMHVLTTTVNRPVVPTAHLSVVPRPSILTARALPPSPAPDLAALKVQVAAVPVIAHRQQLA